MAEADIAFGQDLRQQAGWNQTDADWRRLLALAPEGCFVAEIEGRPVGTVVAVRFGAVAWISMVLVDQSQRGRGVGTAIMEHVLAHLDAEPAASVRLDATDLGEPIYRKLGFQGQFRLGRFQRPAGNATPQLATTSLQVTPATPEAVCNLDRAATATDRRPLLAQLLQEHPHTAWLAQRGDQACGYLMMRPGANAAQIGPAIAHDHETATTLLATALDHLGDRPVFIDVPVDSTALIDHLAGLGFTEQRRFTRMTRGKLICEHVPHLLASSGPEKG